VKYRAQVKWPWSLPGGGTFNDGHEHNIHGNGNYFLNNLFQHTSISLQLQNRILILY